LNKADAIRGFLILLPILPLAKSAGSALLRILPGL
jgi:hypothetical protein